ncbi:MAG: PAS domain S-box protein [Elusimicrobia bacterium]|nr:PAS domain S-box protein [Elusimicrobiota bacterium]
MKTIAEIKNEKKLPAVVVDTLGTITFANSVFVKVFGWKIHDIIGKPLTTIIPKNLHDAHQLGFSRFLTTGTPTLLNEPLKLKALLKDGTVIDAEHFIVAEKINNEWTFAATIKPIRNRIMSD